MAEYLGSFELSNFDAKAPPAKTQAFWEIADASRAPEDAEMARNQIYLSSDLPLADTHADRTTTHFLSNQ